MSDTVYVVLSSRGHYDDELTWISGVYLTEAAAHEAVAEARARRLMWVAWDNAVWTYHSKFGGTLNQAKAQMPPEPEKEEATYIGVHTVPVGQWVPYTPR